MNRVGWLLLGLLLVASAVSAQESTPSYVEYIVMPRDNLTAIAARFNTTTDAILAYNDIPNPNRIKVGQVLRIPLGPPELVPTRVPSATLGPSPTSVPSATSAPPLTPAPSVTPAPTSAALPFDLGGEVVLFDHAREMRRAEMTWAKIVLRWAPGTSLDSASQAIEGAQVEGFNVLLQISGSAQALNDDPAAYIPAFAEYLGQVAALAPEAIEVWGEMNLAPISPATYAQLLSAAYEAIKRGNASTLVVSGALGEATNLGEDCAGVICDELAYLRLMAEADISPSVDCIGIRYTVGALSPDTTSGDVRGETFIYYYPMVVNTFASAFPSKPLCFTGIGYFVRETETVGNEWAANNTPEARADWLGRAVQLAQQTGRIRLFIVYRVDDSVAQDVGYAIASTDHFCLSCLTLGSAMRQ